MQLLINLGIDTATEVNWIGIVRKPFKTFSIFHDFNSHFYRKKDASISGSLTSGDEHSLNRSPQGSRNRRMSKVRSKSLASNRRRSSGVSFNDKPKTIVCPICGNATEVPVGGLCRLPQNFSMVRQVEEAITKTGVQQVARIWCNLCSTDVIVSILADFYEKELTFI